MKVLSSGVTDPNFSVRVHCSVFDGCGALLELTLPDFHVSKLPVPPQHPTVLIVVFTCPCCGKDTRATASLLPYPLIRHLDRTLLNISW